MPLQEENSEGAYFFDGDDVPSHGAPIYSGERQIGIITSATRSPMLETAIAFASRLAVEYADEGKCLRSDSWMAA